MTPNVRLVTQRCPKQVERWPKRGWHIVAQYDGSSIVVDQAYRPSSGRWAAERGTFGGADFSFARMSWIARGKAPPALSVRLRKSTQALSASTAMVEAGTSATVVCVTSRCEFESKPPNAPR